MLKTRVIPTLTLRGSRLVKTCQFGPARDVGHPVKAPMVYDAQLADELIFVDMDASRENRRVEHIQKAVAALTGSCFMPVTAGGGIRSLEDIRLLLLAGADKVTINTGAVDDPVLIKRAAAHFGSQCIVIAIDVRRCQNGAYEVFTVGGTRGTGLQAVDWARRVAQLGAGEILLTSIDRDGTMVGYDLDLVRMVASSVNIPVIASGGAGTLPDLVDVIVVGRAAAAAAASLFHFTDQSPIKVKSFMKRAGVPVR